MASIAHPRDAGAKKALGLPVRGCDLEGWRFPPDLASRGLHVHACGDCWRAHVDAVHPDVDMLEHMRRDVAPAVRRR
jgi:hypothetical protein